MLAGGLFLALLLGLIPAAIASNKGRSFIGWWIFGLLIFIVALPMALIVNPVQSALDARALAGGEMRHCPHCAELIRREARVCRYCSRDVAPAPTAKDM